MVFDSHLQVYSANPLRFPLDATRLFDPAPAPLELALVHMQHLGITGGCLVQPQPYGFDHRYLRESLAAHSGRFVGVGRVDIQAANAAKALRDLMQLPGMRGIRVTAADADGAAALGRADPDFWRTANDLGAVICLQMRPAAAAQVSQAAQAAPAVAFVIDHLGAVDATAGSEERAQIAGLAGAPNIWIKWSGLFHGSRQGFPYADMHGWVRDVVARFGAERVVWGSDFPNCLGDSGYEGQLRAVRDEVSGLRDDDRAAILAGSARRLWRLE